MTSADSDALSVLLKANIADPADDLVRLAYADACDEVGQVCQAHYIRRHLMPGHRNHTIYHDGWLTSGQRSGIWCEPDVDNPYCVVIPVGVTFGFRRGFVEVVRCDPSIWAAVGPELCRVYPVVILNAARVPHMLRRWMMDRPLNHEDIVSMIGYVSSDVGCEGVPQPSKERHLSMLEAAQRACAVKGYAILGRTSNAAAKAAVDDLNIAMLTWAKSYQDG